jgi:hypothetical protein
MSALLDEAAPEVEKTLGGRIFLIDPELDLDCGPFAVRQSEVK